MLIVNKMEPLEDLARKLTELKPNSSLHLPNVSLLLLFFANERLIKEGFKKVGRIEIIPLSLDYDGPIDILRIGGVYRITSSDREKFKVSAEVNGGWSVIENYIKTTVPDVSDEPPELRIYQTS